MDRVFKVELESQEQPTSQLNTAFSMLQPRRVFSGLLTHRPLCSALQIQAQAVELNDLRVEALKHFIHLVLN